MHPPRPNDRTVRDALEFWGFLRSGNVRALFAESTGNTIVQLFRYAITGLSSFLVDFLLLYILERVGMHYLSAAVIAFVAGICFNFFLTKYFAFKEIAPTAGPVVEIMMFSAISAVGLLLTTVLMYLFTSRLGCHFMLSKFLSSIVVFFWNFLGRKLILYPGKI